MAGGRGRSARSWMSSARIVCCARESLIMPLSAPLPPLHKFSCFSFSTLFFFVLPSRKMFFFSALSSIPGSMRAGWTDSAKAYQRSVLRAACCDIYLFLAFLLRINILLPTPNKNRVLAPFPMPLLLFFSFPFTKVRDPRKPALSYS